MRNLIILISLLFTACSTSQFTYYTPSIDESNWRIEVKQGKMGLEFVCLINDEVVIRSNFVLFKNDFENDGIYHNRAIKMSGFKKSYSMQGTDGQTISNDTYTIRVFIEQKEVAVFNF